MLTFYTHDNLSYVFFLNFKSQFHSSSPYICKLHVRNILAFNSPLSHKDIQLSCLMHTCRHKTSINTDVGFLCGHGSQINV